MNLINHENPNHGRKLISHTLSHIKSHGERQNGAKQWTLEVRYKAETRRYSPSIGQNRTLVFSQTLCGV